MLQHQETMSQHQNEAAIRNQVKWRQESIATDFPGRDRNADNTRNIVAIRTNRKVVVIYKLSRDTNLKKLHINTFATQLSMSQHNYSSKHT